MDVNDVAENSNAAPQGTSVADPQGTRRLKILSTRKTILALASTRRRLRSCVMRSNSSSYITKFESTAANPLVTSSSNTVQAE